MIPWQIASTFRGCSAPWATRAPRSSTLPTLRCDKSVATAGASDRAGKAAPEAENRIRRRHGDVRRPSRRTRPPETSRPRPPFCATTTKTTSTTTTTLRRLRRSDVVWRSSSAASRSPSPSLRPRWSASPWDSRTWWMSCQVSLCRKSASPVDCHFKDSGLNLYS